MTHREPWRVSTKNGLDSAGLLGMILTCVAPPVMAQAPAVVAAAADEAQGQLTVWGHGFRPNSRVWLGDQQLTGEVVDAAGTVVTALLPVGPLTPGSYRVVVTVSGGGPVSNWFTVTLGEVGPPGVDGMDGVDGVNGVNGLPGVNGTDGANCYDGIGTTVADCQGQAGTPGPPGAPADVCAVFAAMGTVPLFGTGLPCSPTLRFVDNGDGTITDHQTGLMWEQKNACSGVDLNDVHCVNNLYVWSTSASGFIKPEGPLYTDFLAKLNTTHDTSPDGVAIDRPNFEDWRIPSIVELQGILDCSHPGCLDPVFGPNQASNYWSSTTGAGFPVFAWNANFFFGNVFSNGKGNGFYARGVRGGR